MLKNRLLMVLPALLYGGVARACPVCDSDRAHQIRAGLFDSQFALNLGVTLLPFVVLAAIVALTYYGLPLPRRGAVKRGIE